MPPQPFKTVIFARHRRQNVNDEIAVVHQNPFGVLVAFDADRLFAVLLQLLGDGVTDRLNLPLI